MVLPGAGSEPNHGSIRRSPFFWKYRSRFDNAEISPRMICCRGDLPVKYLPLFIWSGLALAVNPSMGPCGAHHASGNIEVAPTSKTITKNVMVQGGFSCQLSSPPQLVWSGSGSG